MAAGEQKVVVTASASPVVIPIRLNADGDFDRSVEPLKALGKMLRDEARNMADAFSALSNTQQEIVASFSAGKAQVMGVVDSLREPVAQAIAFQKSMDALRPSVQGLGDERAFQQMGHDLLMLSTQIPVSVEGLTEIAAAAGEAGINAQELQGFTASAAKMGIAFGLSGKESVQMMTQWREAFGLTQQGAESLADKISAMGQAGNISSKAMAGMVGALSGATAPQQQALSALKLDPATLAGQVKTDAPAAVLQVLSALKSLPQGEQGSVMAQLFGEGSAQTVGPLLADLDQLRDRFSTLNQAQGEAGAMQQQFRDNASSTADQLLMLKNSTDAITLSLGQAFLPVIGSFAGAFIPVLSSIGRFVQNNGELVAIVGVAAAGLVGFGVTFNFLTTTVNNLGSAWKVINKLFSTSPLGLILLTVAAAIALIAANWDTIGPKVQAVWKMILAFKDSLFAFVDGLIGKFAWLGKLLGGSEDSAPASADAGLKPELPPGGWVPGTSYPVAVPAPLDTSALLSEQKVVLDVNMSNLPQGSNVNIRPGAGGGQLVTNTNLGYSPYAFPAP